MERSIVNIIISVVLLGIVVGSKAKANTTVYVTEKTTAYWAYYEPYDIDWDLNKAGVACAEYDADKPHEWRSEHYWAALCGNAGPFYPASCG
ncbi:hypothetical protein V6N11_017078 [Hibiscus sabdariffa]|uniref:Barwin domain-containing protein n=1 Tax=Hibiscus sabdariffa TaxID=183260 RepID=A0ABR2TX10_9ROSI